MQQLPQPPRRGTVWRRHVLALVGAALLAGCANGDFQEVRPTLVRDDIHDWVGRDAIIGQPTSPSRYSLTDDERALRDLAYPLIEPPYDRHQWYSVAGEYGVIGAEHRGAFDRAAYWNHLVAVRYRSPAARYAQLTDDIRNDVTRLPQFFETAARVLDIDAKRRKSLAFVSRLAPEERENALRRIRENAAIVALVRGSLAERVAGYSFALERLVIQTPSMQAAGVERDLNRLQARIAYYRTHRAPTWVREQSLASAR
jgi:hypothetical protein